MYGTPKADERQRLQQVLDRAGRQRGIATRSIFVTVCFSQTVARKPTEPPLGCSPTRPRHPQEQAVRGRSGGYVAQDFAEATATDSRKQLVQLLLRSDLLVIEDLMSDEQRVQHVVRPRQSGPPVTAPPVDRNPLPPGGEEK